MTEKMIPPGFKSTEEWNGFRFVVESAVRSGFTPIKNVEQGIVIALRGKELGIPPIESLNAIQIIQGKISLSSETMLALALKKVPNAEVAYVTEESKKNDEATYKVRRSKDDQWQTFSFTMDDAKRAGLAGRGGWKTYTPAMLRARCISAIIRAVFPDAVTGQIYTPEEVESYTSVPALESGEEKLALPEPPKTIKERLAAPVSKSVERRVAVQRGKKTYTVITVGKHNGKVMENMETSELYEYLKQIQAIDEKPPEVLGLIQQISAYLLKQGVVDAEESDNETGGVPDGEKLPFERGSAGNVQE